MFPVPVSRIAPLLHCPLPPVAESAPLIVGCLDDLKINSINVSIAALATVAVETAHTFRPIREYGGADYFNAHYGGRVDLGNTEPGDGGQVLRARGSFRLPDARITACTGI
jgi:hypothetical protein